MRTTLDATVTRVVDGDTIRVSYEGLEGVDEAIRILSLDTEESNPSGSKPVTPWGHAAKAAAEAWFSAGDEVRLEFTGIEPLEEALQRYRGNYGRLLVHVFKGDEDFQEYMIRQGYSPYFMKYGHAPDELRIRYLEAEREAQSRHVGVWDPLTVNGSEIRNYAALGTWWQLRGQIIDTYRQEARPGGILNSRLDYREIRDRAPREQPVVIFTEVRNLVRVGGRSAVVHIGSRSQPFSLFLPNVESAAGQQLVWLLRQRYFADGEAHPRRSYAYVAGRLSEFRGQPQIVVTDQRQLTDNAP